jgi:hypothetical protein
MKKEGIEPIEISQGNYASGKQTRQEIEPKARLECNRSFQKAWNPNPLVRTWHDGRIQITSVCQMHKIQCIHFRTGKDN